MALSTYSTNAMLNALLRNASFAVTTIYASLHTGNPGNTGANEVTNGSVPGAAYARKTMAFGAVSGGASANSGTVDFTNMPSATVTHYGLWDAVSGGNFLGGGALAVAKVVGVGDTVEFTPSTATVTLT